MTNTYDTSNFLPCPFCGAAPEAIDLPGGPMAEVLIQCPNDKYDSEDGGCSAGPYVVGSDMEHAAARWNRRAQVPEGQAIGLLARVQGWWQNTDGDMPASLEQDIAAMLTASPNPDHGEDRAVNGKLVDALKKIEAYKIKSSPTATDFGISFDRAVQIAGMKDLARAALSEYRQQEEAER